MFSYYELSAKNIETLQILDNIFITLAEAMIANRERLELTQSSTQRSGIISLSDDWEVLEVPEGPVPDSVYSPQDASIRLRARQHLHSNKCACWILWHEFLLFCLFYIALFIHFNILYNYIYTSFLFCGLRFNLSLLKYLYVQHCLIMNLLLHIKINWILCSKIEWFMKWIIMWEMKY